MKATWNEFEVSAVYKGDKAAGWEFNLPMADNYNRHIVTVKNTITGKLTRFDYWTSLAHPQMQDTKDALLAFLALVDDALTVKEHDFDSFVKEFGYENPSEAYRAYRGCTLALKKVTRLLGSRDLYNLVNTLREVDQ